MGEARRGGFLGRRRAADLPRRWAGASRATRASRRLAPSSRHRGGGDWMQEVTVAPALQHCSQATEFMAGPSSEPGAGGCSPGLTVTVPSHVARYGHARESSLRPRVTPVPPCKGHAGLEWPFLHGHQPGLRPGGLSVVGTGWVWGCGPCLHPEVDVPWRGAPGPEAPIPAPSRGRACVPGRAATTDGWPAALEFPPTNNFYKPPGS